jgi:hypothetical protein
MDDKLLVIFIPNSYITALRTDAQSFVQQNDDI